MIPWKVIKKAIRSARFRDNFRESPRVEILFCSRDSQRVDLINGKYFDRILDPIINESRELGYSVGSLGLPYSEIIGDKCWNSILSCNRYYSFQLIKSLFVPKLNLSAARKNIYSTILQTLKPKCVIGIHLPFELINAAKSLGIPAVEIVHGFGYGKLGWKDRDPKELPSAMFSFDAASTQKLIDEHESDFKIYTLDYGKNLNYIGQFYPTDETKKRHSKPQVLFSLQWGYAKHDRASVDMPEIPNGLIPEAVLEAVRLSSENIDWHFRLHPVQRTSQYASTQRLLRRILSRHSNTEWQFASAEPLHSYLAGITHHISMSSATAYECSLRGVPSLFLDTRYLEGNSHGGQQPELRSAGALTVGDYSPRQILEWISDPKVRDFSKIGTKGFTDLQVVLTELLNNSTDTHRQTS